jgi:hypothetical protein
MRSPSTAELLHAWESAVTQRPVERALTLAALAHPRQIRGSLDSVTTGERDRYLLHLRECVFGSIIQCVCDCPGCGTAIELEFDIAKIRFDSDAGGTQSEHTLTRNGVVVRFRIPTCADLSATASMGSVEAIARELLVRCVIEVEGAEEWPDWIPEAVADAILRIDPQSEVLIDLVCPSCAHRGKRVFDICSFLWAEVQNWALRTFNEVDTLARAYGWREQDILAMSSARRRVYLELATA